LQEEKHNMNKLMDTNKIFLLCNFMFKRLK